MKKILSGSVVAGIILMSFFLLTAKSYGQVSYPKAIGLVNDFANVLSADKRQELEIKLKDFEKQTSIELTVVTVESLQGLSVERFTLGLANTWGVGKADQNNGVVLLIAPIERKLRIEVGLGLKQRLTNSAADNIIQSDILPLFKNQQMEAGILAGAQSLMRKLESSAPTQPKTMVSAKVAEQAATQKSASEGSPYFLLIVFGGLAVVVSLILLGVWLKNQAEFRQQVLTDLEEEEKRLEVFARAYPAVEQNLFWLTANQPESVWSDLKKGFQITSAPSAFVSEFQRLQDSCYSKTHSFLSEEAELLATFGNKLKKSQIRLDKIQSMHAAVTEAIGHGRQMLTSLPLKINLVTEAVKQEDVTEETRERLTAAAAKFAELQNKVVGTLPDQQIDWLTAHQRLDKLTEELKAIEVQAGADQSVAARARIEGPELLRKMKERLDQLEKDAKSSKARKLLAQGRKQYEQALARAPQGGGLGWTESFLLLMMVDSSFNQVETADRSESSWSSHSSSDSYSSSFDSGSSGMDFGGGSFGGDSGASGSW